MKTVHLAFCSDRANIPFLSVALRSVIDNASCDYLYCVYVVHDGMTYCEKGCLLALVRAKKNFRLSFIDIDEYSNSFSKLFVSGHISHAAYWRFALPEILNNIDKLIYLDTDVVVIDDIAKLYEENLGEGEALAGAPGIGVAEELQMTEASRRILLQRGYSNFKKYINSGVLLVNMKVFREEKLLDRLLDIAASENFPLHDQDVLNLVLMNRIKILDWRWNFAIHETIDSYPKYLIDVVKDRISSLNISIVHYVGSGKPWKCTSRPLAGLWIMYAIKTPFFSGMKFPCTDSSGENQGVKIKRGIKAKLKGLFK